MGLIVFLLLYYTHTPSLHEPVHGDICTYI